MNRGSSVFALALGAGATQSLTGVGIASVESLAPGALTTGPGGVQSITGIGIAASESAAPGALTALKPGSQALTGVGIPAAEVTAAGTLREGAGPLQALQGVGIAPSESTPAGLLTNFGTLPLPSVQVGWLTAAQLASLQGTVLRSLPWTCIVLENTQTKNQDDDEADLWQPKVVYNCDVEYLMQAGEESTVAGQLQAISGYLVTLPFDAVVNPENRLSVNGIVYEVRNTNDNWTDETAVYVIAEKVE